MSAVILKGHPAVGIPRGTEYQVCSLPENRRVSEGLCSGSLPLDLDPGKYIAVFTKNDPRNPRRMLMRHYETFYVNIPGDGVAEMEKNFSILKGLHPKTSKPMQVSDGVRWACQIGGCDFSGMSEYSTVEHEAKHQGYDLSDPDDRARYLVAQDPMATSKTVEIKPTKPVEIVLTQKK